MHNAIYTGTSLEKSMAGHVFNNCQQEFKYVLFVDDINVLLLLLLRNINWVLELIEFIRLVISASTSE